MEIIHSISIGVAGGLVATLISAIIFQYWNKVIKPGFENMVYKDSKIEGRWELETEFQGKQRSGIMGIKRSGHQITGTVTHVDEDDKYNTYEIIGSFKNLILTVSYDSTDKSTIARGSLTLMLMDNGSRFEGWLAYYSFDTKEICSTKYTCKRIAVRERC
jgi:hypothetical protein